MCNSIPSPLEFPYGRTDARLPPVRNTSTRMALACLCLGLVACAMIAPPARAAEINRRCVGTVAQLQQAIADANAGDEGSTWDIRVRTGTYSLSNGLAFNPSGDKDDKEFLLRGGWNQDCSQQTTRDPSFTTLYASNAFPAPEGADFLFKGDNSAYVIYAIHFSRFHVFQVDDKFCSAGQICPDTGYMVINKNKFSYGGWVSIIANDANALEMQQNLVANVGGLGERAVFIRDAAASESEIGFNTFADLACGSTGEYGLYVRTKNPEFMFHHNIVRSTSCATDLFVATSMGGIPITPRNNLLLTHGGGVEGDLIANGNVISADPQFVDPAKGDYRLAATSPAVNKGMSLVQALQADVSVPSTDLRGQVRLVGTRYDIGAHESPINDNLPAAIVVTSNSDSGPGSLRAAIATANAWVGDPVPQTITFDMPGNCPRTIALQSPLPDITDSVVIDGYTQPGSQRNSDNMGSDASVCVTLVPAVAGVTHALRVASDQPATTTLVADGLSFGSAFAAFATAAIDLRGGEGHVVRGSVFGGLLPQGGSIGSVPRGVMLRDNAVDAHIGASDAASRNYFGGLGNNAIQISGSATSGHYIVNNYIGVAPNGLAVQPNAADGIYAFAGATGVRIRDNVIDGSVRGIYLGSNTQGFTVLGNRIGVNAAGYGVAQHANDAGIVVGSGSGHHAIGEVNSYPNLISGNRTAGVQVQSSAGSGVTIVNNRIWNNGRDGMGLGIDLGDLGPLPNDDGDADAGPNGLQNYPVIIGLDQDSTPAKVTAALNTQADTSILFAFYHAPNCPGGQRGADAESLVGLAIASMNSGSGVVSVAVDLDPTHLTSGYLAATATNLDTGDTSELSPCFAVDTIFRDAFQKRGL
ncbi:parallel beta helix pectate lyase-like protein [Dokdonella fugitiva]|uniref:Parallel beta helix pectate lyase-like protein n=1 Tax=Dokdonella fugitiva TaxID=328517 RepID=A0A4R2HXX9_9GAMM|nr:parallel beta helix pectate lyase-like protein [Dokdonella fugitiva]